MQPAPYDWREHIARERRREAFWGVAWAITKIMVWIGLGVGITLYWTGR